MRTAQGIYWFTGLSGSGKTTLSLDVAARLRSLGRGCLVLDGDIMRSGLCADLGFSAHDRTENIRRAGEVARLASLQGCICLCAFITPYEGMRQKLRQRLGDLYHEIFLDCPISTCMERDPKQNYQKVRQGELHGYTGIDALFEPPASPDLRIETARLSIAEGARAITEYILKTSPSGDK